MLLLTSKYRPKRRKKEMRRKNGRTKIEKKRRKNVKEKRGRNGLKKMIQIVKMPM